jgi:hypothetical protein
MTGVFLVEFSHPGRLRAAARAAARANYRVIDAFTPFPVEGISGIPPTRPGRIRIVMFIAGIVMAAFAYSLQYYSAVIGFPYNSGGRPLDSWPTFWLVPFSTGILVAAIAGFATFLLQTGLPRLHDPLFAVEGFERTSQDRFVLAVAKPDDEVERQHALEWLRHTGADAVREVEL